MKGNNNKRQEGLTINLRGDWTTKQVWINGKQLNPKKSLRVCNHSPDGFNWGYAGSGPTQLALAICLELYSEEKAQRIHQTFKLRYIAELPQSDFDEKVKILI